MRVGTVVAVGLLAAASLGGCGSADRADDPATAPTTTAASSPTSTATEPTDPAAPEGALVIGHRGASADAPEHTFAAYDLALDQGATHIEQDLQMTADGELVVLHDETLDRTARGPAEDCTGLVREKTLAQVQRCDVGSWFNEAHPDLADPAYVGLRIPTMREVLDRYGPDTRYYVETKAPEAQPGMEDALLALLDEAGLTAEGATAQQQVLVQSFSLDSLRAVHDRAPDLPLVLLVPISGQPIPAATLDEAAEVGVGVGPAEANVDAALVAAAHERCLVVHPYTVDDPTRMADLLALGVDGMFTNAPRTLVEVVATAGAPTVAPPADC